MTGTRLAELAGMSDSIGRAPGSSPPLDPAPAKTSARDADPVRVLEQLLVLCVDGAAGYRHAAEAVTKPLRLHAMLTKNAAQREEIASVLTYALIELGHKPTRHGSLEGAVHRRWLDALTAFAAGGSAAVHAILKECERGERHTIEAFTRALGRSLPDQVHDVVQSQLGRVLEASAALRREITFLDDDTAAS